MGKDKIKAHGILLVFLFLFFVFDNIFLPFHHGLFHFELLAGRMVGQKRTGLFNKNGVG
jgi:hypothetical protein